MRYTINISKQAEAKYPLASTVINASGHKRTQLILSVIEAYFSEHRLSEIHNSKDAGAVISISSVSRENEPDPMIAINRAGNKKKGSKPKEPKPKAIQNVEAETEVTIEDAISKGNEPAGIDDESVQSIFNDDIFGQMLDEI